MPINAQIGNVSYVLCSIVGGLMALKGGFSLTIGKLVSFLTFNKSFNMPINQISQQINTLLEEHPDTASYISESQNVWGKIFNTHEINILLGLVDYLGLDWDYVLILLSYCRRLSERRGSTCTMWRRLRSAFMMRESVTRCPCRINCGRWN